MKRANEFSPSVKKLALFRQKNKCASCGAFVPKLGEAGREGHEFGERAEAHHRRPVRKGGAATVGNCVVLCESCHYNAHEGGKFGTGTVIGRKKDFDFFKG